MTKQTINIGRTPNDNQGDSLRVAFSKINANFTEVYTNAASGGASVTESVTPPISPVAGDLWYDTAGGRLYVFYDHNWVDSNPTPYPAVQIQSDWTQTNNTALDYIKNKPTIPAAQVPSDWTATSGVSRILNKPTIPTSFNELVNGSYNFTLGVDGTINFDPAANGKGVLQTTADLWFNANGAIYNFGANGSMTFPDATVQTTAYQKVAVPAHSYGSAGDKAGMLAFDSTYIYYCTADYVNNSTNIWKRTAHGAGTW